MKCEKFSRMQFRTSQHQRLLFVRSIICFIVYFVIHDESVSVVAFTQSSNQQFICSTAGGLQSKKLINIIHSCNQQTIQSTRNNRIMTFSMHMGHSHSHHSHEHNDNQKQQQEVISNKSQQKADQGNLIRRYSLLLFCAFVTLGRPFITTKSAGGWKALRFSDYAAFTISTICCRFFLEPIRNEIKHAMKRIQMLGNGIAKHAPPSSFTFFSMTRLLLSPSSQETSGLIDPSKIIDNNNNAADRVTILGGFMNILLSIAKLIVGINCHSSALIADAGHSLSDLFSDFITLWAVQVGRLPPDDDHPYGHGKFEAIGALFLALTLLGTGLSVGWMSYQNLIEIIAIKRAGSMGGGATLEIPTFPALLMAGISIVSKEWLFRVTRKVGERINSQVVIANAWHHRSDAYSSVLALFSIGLAMCGMIAADAAAGLLVAGMICMTGAEILGESVKQLTDTSDEKLVKRITTIAANSKDIESVNRIRARQVGSSALIDLSVTVREDIASVSQAREVEERLRTRILQEDGVLDVDVKVVSSGSPKYDEPERLISGELVAASNEIIPIISKVEVETTVRHEILHQHPEVQLVHGITIHYQDIVTNPINVDVDISLLDDTTIADASVIAENVRLTLEKSYQINKANIYLDLNQNIYQSETLRR